MLSKHYDALMFVVDRLEHVYKENPSIDYIQAARNALFVSKNDGRYVVGSPEQVAEEVVSLRRQLEIGRNLREHHERTAESFAKSASANIKLCDRIEVLEAQIARLRKRARHGFIASLFVRNGRGYQDDGTD